MTSMANRMGMYMRQAVNWVRRRREARRASNRSRPMCIRVVLSVLKVLPVMLLALITYSVWFYYGEPAITTDYVELIRQLDTPSEVVGENGWPHYARAAELYIAPNDAMQEILYRSGLRRFDDANDTEQKIIRRWVWDNNAAWRELEAGSRQGYCIPEWGHGEQEKLLIYYSPTWYSAFQVGNIGIWRLRIAEVEGDFRAMLEDSMTLIRVGGQLLDTHSLRMWGLIFDEIGRRKLLQLVRSASLSAEALKEVQEELEDIFDGSYPSPSRALDRLYFLSDVERLFSRGGPGGGHLLPRSLGKYQEYDYMLESSLTLGAIAYCYLVPSEYDGMIHFLEGTIGKNRTAALVRTVICLPHARRRKTVAMANKLFDALEVEDKMTPYALHTSKSKRAWEVADDLSRNRYWVVWSNLGGSTHSWAHMHYEGKMLHEAVQTVLALRRWRLDKGEYPGRLQPLVTGGYLHKIAMDPYSDKPLIYRRMEDDFLLYSVGRNFKDDGGKAASLGRWGSEWGKGDAVFWPAPPERRDVESPP